ncbi:MAG: CinA family protein [Alphaproteobacteria bacterium]|nr:CinA family protein [Alphaproteobacteria bacterium]
MVNSDLVAKAAALLAACRAKRLKLATAESCTGGLIAGTLTEVAGSSDVVDRGFVTYSNEAKAELLGIAPELIATKGAVSAEVARAMVEGAIARSRADIVVAVTGIAGPTGGSRSKPVGLVHFAVLRRGGTAREDKQVFPGDRATVRQATVGHALALIEQVVETA